MIKLETVSKLEACGRAGSMGIHIQVGHTRVSKSELKKSDAFMKVIYKAQREIENELGAVAFEKSEQRQQLIDNNEKLLGLFDSPIYVDRVKNEYWKDHYMFRDVPWFIITTVRGRIKIGNRKRVISIDWWESDVKSTSVDLFPAEDVTKEAKLIHAWGLEKAQEYINKIMESN